MDDTTTISTTFTSSTIFPQTTAMDTSKNTTAMRIADLEAELAATKEALEAALEEQEDLIARTDKLLREKRRLEGDKCKVEEQYTDLLEQTGDPITTRVKRWTTTVGPKYLPFSINSPYPTFPHADHSHSSGLRPRNHLVICIHCYLRDLPCDRGTPCGECSKATSSIS
ncbi:hypothetical protein PTMSG1_04758 [Pyrenophora teres f. maculata]|nr:hypothetical protein PTMSG1_04758 [Pyrenophora teres f. maculata]